MGTKDLNKAGEVGDLVYQGTKLVFNVLVGMEPQEVFDAAEDGVKIAAGSILTLTFLIWRENGESDPVDLLTLWWGLSLVTSKARCWPHCR